MGTDGKGTRLDLDVVTAWVASNAGRWNVTDPVAALPADAGGAQIRDAATNAVAGIAAAMTGTEKTPATEHDRRAAEIAEWLADCLNETASGAEDGPPEDACEPLATSGGRGCTPTRRWAAALREHAQHVEIGWRRGRHGGGLAFTVKRMAGRWTITEHGGTTSDAALRDAIIPAVASAVMLTAKDAGKTANSRESVEAGLRGLAVFGLNRVGPRRRVFHDRARRDHPPLGYQLPLAIHGATDRCVCRNSRPELRKNRAGG